MARMVLITFNRKAVLEMFKDDVIKLLNEYNVSNEDEKFELEKKIRKLLRSRNPITRLGDDLANFTPAHLTIIALMLNVKQTVHVVKSICTKFVKDSKNKKFNKKALEVALADAWRPFFSINDVRLKIFKFDDDCVRFQGYANRKKNKTFVSLIESIAPIIDPLVFNNFDLY